MKNVLVVDDDETYVYLIERQLRSMDKNLTIKSCASGKEALEYLEALSAAEDTPPDLVMLDLNMPVMGGFDFLEAFDKICKKNSVVVPPPDIWIVTSSNMDGDKERAGDFPFARGYLVKPIGKKDIQHLLKTGS